MDIFVEEWGAGERVVLVHGAMTNGETTWRRQRPLADRWLLVVPNRRGYVPNPPAEVSDYDVDADDVVALLGDGAHLVGHSYGGLVALFAAARRPEAIRSLCLLEPAAHALARGDPDVARSFDQHDRRRRTISDPREFLIDFMGGIGGASASVPEPLPPVVEQHARLFMRERVPFEAEIPVAALAAAPFPKLVISGGHEGGQEKVSDACAAAIGAQRAVLAGAGHLVPRAPGCNEMLEELWAGRYPPTRPPAP
jgi:pimeloyl-ACP methyl ester carboxylesterase